MNTIKITKVNTLDYNKIFAIYRQYYELDFILIITLFISILYNIYKCFDK